MLKGLFLNSPAAQCSIHESGKMIYAALKTSGNYTLDYKEIDANNRNIPNSYDFLIFNYHPFTMDWLDTSTIRRKTGLAITFVLEVLPNDPFPMCPASDFDIYCALDPTIQHSDMRVHAFPRPLDQTKTIITNRTISDIPVIGSFGFATPGKGFEHVVTAVNKEFNQAIIRINIPIGTHAGKHAKAYGEELSKRCIGLAKPGIEVRVTHDYMSKEDLIRWCSENTLNCFLYDRNQPGLSATTDQAISSGRPLSVSDNLTFRHILKYIFQPYPVRNLKGSIAASEIEVTRMQNDWTPQAFATRFEEVLYSCNIRPHFQTGESALDIKSGIEMLRTKIRNHFNPTARIPNRGKNNYPVILFVSHPERRCGIHQYGLDTFEALQHAQKYIFVYKECRNASDLNKILSHGNFDAVIYNYYPTTMPWLTSKITRKQYAPQIGIMHEVTQDSADNADNSLFDCHLCPDPTLVSPNPIALPICRLIPKFENSNTKQPEIPIIGSFGFGFPDKGFEKIVKLVSDEFDSAIVRFNIPYAGAADMLRILRRKCIDGCYNAAHENQGIHLEITDTFLDKSQLLAFLAGNTVNVFLYDVDKDKGISSGIDYALAVNRPVAINKCGMFRHIKNATPSICIENSSLKEIIAAGTTPLQPFREMWSEKNFITRYEKIMDKVI